MIHLGKIRLKKKQLNEAKRITEYLVSGGAFFWSGYIAFFVADKVFSWSLWWATCVSYLIGWTINYILQRYWVFNNTKLKHHETEVTSRYVIISLLNVPINYAILAALKSVGISPYIGQFVSSGFFTVWNYMWYKLWVFNAKNVRKRHA